MVLAFILLLLLAMAFDSETLKIAYSQLARNIKIWKDSDNNVRILFSYSPDDPIINTPTELLFTINDLRTGAAFKNVLVTIIIIGSSNGQQKVVRFSVI